jgi:hypothetical protein
MVSIQPVRESPVYAVRNPVLYLFHSNARMGACRTDSCFLGLYIQLRQCRNLYINTRSCLTLQIVSIVISLCGRSHSHVSLLSVSFAPSGSPSCVAA